VTREWVATKTLDGRRWIIADTWSPADFCGYFATWREADAEARRRNGPHLTVVGEDSHRFRGAPWASNGGPSYSGLPLRPSSLAGLGHSGSAAPRFIALRRFSLGDSFCNQGPRSRRAQPACSVRYRWRRAGFHHVCRRKSGRLRAHGQHQPQAFEAWCALRRD
jgi:hypothetical protein